jgi:hypothetical protein
VRKKIAHNGKIYIISGVTEEKVSKVVGRINNDVFLLKKKYLSVSRMTGGITLLSLVIVFGYLVKNVVSLLGISPLSSISSTSEPRKLGSYHQHVFRRCTSILKI